MQSLPRHEATTSAPMNLFRAPSRSQAEWFSVGLTSSFPDVGLDEESLSQLRICATDVKPGCKVFNIPRTDDSQRSEVLITPGAPDFEMGDLKDQVLVFQYRGKFHAVDHVSQVAPFPNLRVSRTNRNSSGMPSLVVPSFARHAF